MGPRPRQSNAMKKRKTSSKSGPAPRSKPPVVRVTKTVLRGGYVVYSSPVKPRHFTDRQIADAVDKLVEEDDGIALAHLHVGHLAAEDLLALLLVGKHR